MHNATNTTNPLYETGVLPTVTGGPLRPGGLPLTGYALDVAGCQAGQRILDLGCGNGASTSYARSRSMSAIGLDPSAGLLAQAVNRGLGGRVVLSTACCLPLRAATFDAVLCECVLSLTARPDCALAEMRRVLAPGGVLVLSDLYVRNGGLIEHGVFQGRTASCCARGAHSLEALGDMLGNAGFVLEHVEDRSSDLAHLAAQLVFAGQGRALAELSGGCGEQGVVPRLGYVLMVARVAQTGEQSEQMDGQTTGKAE